MEVTLVHGFCFFNTRDETMNNYTPTANVMVPFMENV